MSDATKQPAALLMEFMERASKAGQLPSLSLNLTTRCNLDCVHCYRAPERRTRPKELTTQEWIDVVRQARDLGTMWLVLTGGEPLARPDWRELVAEFDAMGMAQHIFTNGTYIDEPAADFLARHRVHRVQISLLGATAPVHDKLTQVKGSFDKTKVAISFLAERHIVVDVVCTVMKHNAREVADFISLVRDMGANPMLGLHVYSGFDGHTSPMGLTASDEELLEVMNLARSEGVQTTTVTDECLDPSAKAEETSICGAGQRSVAVNADGTVWPCVSWPLVVGDVRHQSVAEIWHHSRELHRVRGYRRSDLEACVACDLAGWCTHCPASALLEGKTVLEPSEVDCRMARLAKKFADGVGPVLEVEGLFEKR